VSFLFGGGEAAGEVMRPSADSEPVGAELVVPARRKICTMASTVRCLGCGFEIPADKRICPKCMEPQPTNRKGYIALSVGFFALLLVAWLAMKLFGN
jgi:predicted nucleic acid-binding Zn ribbon protein